MSMFKNNKRPEPAPATNHTVIVESHSPNDATVIGVEIAVTGTLSGNGNVQIEGKLDGEVRIEGKLLIVEGAVVNADVSATAITISGSVTGNVRARKVEITSSGKVFGDLEVDSLLVGEGAVYEGRSKMSKGTDTPLLDAPLAQEADDSGA